MHLQTFEEVGCGRCIDLGDVTDEQAEILTEFVHMLKMPTADGAIKRGRGLKPSWKVDSSHTEAAERHRDKRLRGDTYDADSGAHHGIHEAWRLLAVAWQEGATAEDSR